MTQRPASERGAIDVAEEAFHLVRKSGGHVIAPYAIGSAPFALAMVYFCTEMTYSAAGYQRLALFAFVLAGLFVWMKAWHAIYAQRLRAAILGEPAGRIPLRRALQIAHTQLIVHTAGVFILPLSLIAILPLPWVYAFFQNASVQGDGRDEPLRHMVARSARLASLWPRQNAVIMWLLSPLLLLVTAGLFFVVGPVFAAIGPETGGGEFLFGITIAVTYVLALVCIPLCPLGVVVLLNLMTLIYLLPELARMLFGMETTTMQVISSGSDTMQMVLVALAYLCLDPIAKAAYVLRCHYGESLTTGADLAAQWRDAVARAGRALAALAVIAGTMWAGTPAAAQDTAVSPPELEQRIDEVLQRSEFTWRMPRDERQFSGEQGPIMAFMSDVNSTIKSGLLWLRERWDGIRQWFNDQFSGGDGNEGGFDGFYINPQWLSIGLLIVGGLVLGFLLYRVWRTRPAVFQEAEAFGPAAPPDLEQDDLIATDFPEDTWAAMARDLIEKGQYRAALRAFFLAQLAVLGEQGLVQIAKAKSNREYQRELQRRAHALPELPPIFVDRVRDFERVWYGTAEAGQETVARAAADYERIRSLARPQ